MNILSFKVTTAATIPDLNPAWSNDQLNIKFAFSREGNVLTINLEAANQTLADEITDFVFQGIHNSKTLVREFYRLKSNGYF